MIHRLKYTYGAGYVLPKYNSAGAAYIRKTPSRDSVPLLPRDK